jgi:hypothetical protein
LTEFAASVAGVEKSRVEPDLSYGTLYLDGWPVEFQRDP